MAKKTVKDMVSQRSPLSQREAITPVGLYTSPQDHKPTNPQVDMPTDGQAHSSTSPQVGEPTSPLIEKTTSGQEDPGTNPRVVKTTKPQVEKYTTHLRQATIKAVKRAAFESDRKDYEIVQDALDEYFKSRGMKQ
jgi:hypothetical protein